MSNPNKKLKVYTAQYGYKGPNRLDTTVKTAKHCAFAPTWNLVLGHKDGKITDEQYTSGYLGELHSKYLRLIHEWDHLLNRDEVVLVCFCQQRKFCHRVVLAQLLVSLYGAEYIGEIDQTRGHRIVPGHEIVFGVLSQEVVNACNSFTFPQRPDLIESTPLVSAHKPLDVDPLAISEAQGSVCRTCRENRTASAWTRKGIVNFSIVGEELGSKEQDCCAKEWVDGEAQYACSLFKDLVLGYEMGLKTQGTNFDPCKNCPSHVDRGGNCLGDRCPDGPFPILERSGYEVKC